MAVLRFDMEGVLWHLLAGTRGGPNRAAILRLLAKRPYNLHQMARSLNVGYKTIIHHVEVLVRNDLVECTPEKRYGEMYYLTPLAREHLAHIERIVQDLEKS
ncbi:Bacterial regulatory protein, arsR family [uncultured archaeon]|nr:Bacterial regulatory protein, arsR family [uncultured archaeon]